MSTNPPAGWYPNQEGTSQWWDGTQWTEHRRETSPANSLHMTALKNGAATTALVLGLVGLLINPLGITGIIGLCFAIAGLSRATQLRRQGHPSKGAAKSWWGLTLSVAGIIFFYTLFPSFLDSVYDDAPGASQSTESGPSTDSSDQSKSEAEQYDEHMIEQGFSVVDSGENYIRWYTSEEMAASTCSFSNCLYGVVASRTGCSSGFYVKADILRDETAVGWTNVTTASVQPTESVSFRIDDHEGIGDGFRFAEVNCMS